MNKISFRFFALISLVILLPTAFVVASSSDNYDMTQERGGVIEYDASSDNYDIKAEVGTPAVGQSTSDNYIYDHGTWWVENESSLTAVIQWLAPEMRVGGSGTNDDATFYLKISDSADEDPVTVVFTSGLLDTANDGTYSTPIDLTGVSAGDYDVFVKTDQHLTKKLDDITLSSGANTFNFTQADNSSSKGALKLTAGDISGAGTSATTLGDDIINSVDITVLLSDFNSSDADGNTYRANLNQDTIVNSVDLTMILANFNEEGEV